MADSQQDARLFEGRDGPAAAVQAEPAKVPCNLKLRSANREQLKVVTIDVDQLIPPTHKARAIWCLTGKMDLSAFFEGLSSVAGGRGRRPWDPVPGRVAHITHQAEPPAPQRLQALANQGGTDGPRG